MDLHGNVSSCVKQMNTLADSGRKECAQMLTLSSLLQAGEYQNWRTGLGSFSPLVLLRDI